MSVVVGIYVINVKGDLCYKTMCNFDFWTPSYSLQQDT